MYKEVTKRDALAAHIDGKKVLCLNEKDNVNYTLDYYLEGLRFLVDEPEPVSAPETEPEEGLVTTAIASVENLAVEPVTAPEEPEQKKHSTKKLNIDIPKMKALKEAGWSDTKIADEFRISMSSVYRYLHMKDEKEKE